MHILVKADGTVTEHEIPPQPLTVLLHEPSIKIEAPTALLIDVKATTTCMEQMPQRAWEHISTGPLFQHFFSQLFHDRPVTLPSAIATLLADYDEGVIHACGLIVMLVESRFAGRREVFIKNPETHLHPAVTYRLMSMVEQIMKIGGDGGAIAAGA